MDGWRLLICDQRIKIRIYVWRKGKDWGVIADGDGVWISAGVAWVGVVVMVIVGWWQRSL